MKQKDWEKLWKAKTYFRVTLKMVSNNEKQSFIIIKRKT